MKAFIKKLKKNSCLKKYFKIVPPLLIQRYGGISSYTAAQLEKTLSEHKIKLDYVQYLYAFFLSKDGFENIKKLKNEQWNYEALRAEVFQNYPQARKQYRQSGLNDSEFGGDAMYSGHDH